MSTTTKDNRIGAAELEESHSGFGRLMGKLGGLFTSRKAEPHSPEPALGPIEMTPIAAPVEIPLPPPRRKAAVKSPAYDPGRSGVRRSLESSRELLEPIVDVFEESDHILVFALLPGVDPDLSHVELIEDLLVISSSPPGPVHRKEVPLPAVFDPECMSRSARGNVLEVRLDLNWSRRIRPGSASGD